jgi:RAD50-interacting protein 1
MRAHTASDATADAVADAKRAYVDAVRLARARLRRADDVKGDDDDDERETDSRLASTSLTTATTLARAADVANALANISRTLERACACALSVSEIEEDDASWLKIERAASECARASATFRAMSIDAAIDGDERRVVNALIDAVRDLGAQTCAYARDSGWRMVGEMFSASGWPPDLRPTALQSFTWTFARVDGGDDADRAMEEMKVVRAFHALSATSEARAGFAGDESFVYDDCAAAFAESLSSALRATFGGDEYDALDDENDDRMRIDGDGPRNVPSTTSSALKDPRRPERLFACAKELTTQTPSAVRAELERVVFVDSPKSAVRVTRNYLSHLVHAVAEVVRTHICVACAASEDPWWLHVADECKSLDDAVSKNAYATSDTPRTLDALLHNQAHAEAWMGIEFEHALERSSAAWRAEKRWTRRVSALIDDGDVEFKAPSVAEVILGEIRNAIDGAQGLSRVDWRLYFIKRVAAPVLDDFLDACERRAVGTRGLGSLVASSGSWRAGSNGTHVIASAINACAFVAHMCRAMADETSVLEFGGDVVFEARAEKFEKFVSRWTDAIADAACAQFTDKIIGDVFVGESHVGVYARKGDEDEDEDEDEETPRVAPSGFILAALGPLRERIEDARSALGHDAFNACWRAIATTAASTVVKRVIEVATFTPSGARQMRRDARAFVDIFAPYVTRQRVCYAKTRVLHEAVSLLTCDVALAKEIRAALMNNDDAGVNLVASKRRLDVDALDNASIARVLATRADLAL